MRDADDLAFAALLGSRFPVIVVETPEEARVLQLAERVANLMDTALYAWSATSGIRRVNGRDATAGTAPLGEALRHIHATPAAGLYALLDGRTFSAPSQSSACDRRILRACPSPASSLHGCTRRRSSATSDRLS